MAQFGRNAFLRYSPSPAYTTCALRLAHGYASTSLGSSPTYQEEYYKQYFYHSDHLGSASLISDYKGDEYQRIEYTPYGETWVEKTSNTGLEFLPYKFTAKELSIVF